MGKEDNDKDALLKKLYCRIIEELVSNEVIISPYQCAIIKYDYIGNVNKYYLLISDLLDDDCRFRNQLKINVNNPIKRIRKTITYIENAIKEKEVSSDLVSHLRKIIDPDNNEEKYLYLVKQLKKNDFYNPITLEFLQKKIKNPGMKYFEEDIFNYAGYDDRWFIKNIINSSYIEWTMGCLIEKSFFNVRKNDLYINLPIRRGLCDYDNQLIMVGLFVENLDFIRNKLKKYLVDYPYFYENSLYDENTLECIKKNYVIPRDKVQKLYDILIYIKQNDFFSNYYNDIDIVLRWVIDPFLIGTRNEAENQINNISKLLSGEFITIKKLLENLRNVAKTISEI